MADLISKARMGRLAALQGRSCTMLFPEVEPRAERGPATGTGFRSRRVVSLFG